jgi:ubiquinone/menaquinone biosynthesis C-methylase UbiE
LDNLQRTDDVSTYFDALYRSLSSSGTHELIGKEALGDGYVGQLGYAGESELYHLAELTGMGKGQHVLDLCCGMGGTSLWFALQTGAHVTGLDCSAVGLEIGKLSSLEKAASMRFVQGDIRHLPFLPHSFDSVICLDGFGAAFAEVFQQCFRILTARGSLAFLLNVTRQSRYTLESALHSAGFVDIRCVPAGECGAILMQTWLDSYRKYRRAHIREIGRQPHQALTGEIAGLLKQFEQEQVERLFVSAVKNT